MRHSEPKDPDPDPKLLGSNLFDITHADSRLKVQSDWVPK
jgi:hypothetical protein